LGLSPPANAGAATTTAKLNTRREARVFMGTVLLKGADA
jgi:hypothetical protein